ncbi:MAG: molybdopterin molybdotransferase MoeA [Anaerolineaceae bacterium]|nr:molybdopterin molybdotransferase MoeA [Anaerolineaceae bacterium]
MLSVDEAIQRILQDLRPLPAEAIGLENGLGRILARDLHASINLPPFANSSMDGYALRVADLKGASPENPVQLAVVMDIPAGRSPERPVGPGEAARIMTGAPLPGGADAVVPVEQTDANWNRESPATLAPTLRVMTTLQPGDYIRPVGENVRAGQQVLEAGTRLRPQHLGMLAALGQAQVSVYRQPRVTIVSSGDEIIDVGETLAPGQIYDVNSYTIEGLVRELGGIPLRQPVAGDDLKQVRAMFDTALGQDPDLIISTAGVSVGAHDLVRDVLEELGQLNFWRVNMRPGKPLAWGRVQGLPFFGLPGNPVSAMVTFQVFVRPALQRLTGHRHDFQAARATLCEDVESDGRRSFLRVTLERSGGRLLARSTGTQSSGALISMVLADGLLIVPEGVTRVGAGTELEVLLLQ